MSDLTLVIHNVDYNPYKAYIGIDNNCINARKTKCYMSIAFFYPFFVNSLAGCLPLDAKSSTISK